ncbi:2,3-butanediol dehydrogenase [Exiguobacterium sp.]|uniref:2,3-butanediol dehydrogenase n=1 Tax=Exiguobacterium sp. TaxID=44751 RepID=UPI00307D6339
MKAAKFYAAKDIRIDEISEKEISLHKVKVEVEWCGICGSDLHEYVAGPLNIPGNVVLGHEYAGTVVEIGEEVRTVKVGDRVVVETLRSCGECEYCLEQRPQLCDNIGIQGLTEDGGFATYAVADEKYMHVLPDHLSLEHGALVEPAAVAHHAVKNSKLKAGNSCVVFGAGPVGLLVTAMAKVKGASQIIVVEMAEERRNRAMEVGATHIINPLEVDVVSKIKELTGDKGVDVAFEAAGVQPTFVAAMEALKKGGELMIVAMYEKEVSIMLNEFIISEKSISLSFAYANNFKEVIDLFAEGKVNLETFVTKKIYLDDIKDEGFESLIHDKSQCKILVTPKKENVYALQTK